MMNHLHNAQFRPGPDDSLLYFTHEGNVRWQDPATQGYHACVMSHTRRNRNTAELCAADLGQRPQRAAFERLDAGEPQGAGSDQAAVSETERRVGEGRTNFPDRRPGLAMEISQPPYPGGGGTASFVAASGVCRDAAAARPAGLFLVVTPFLG